MAFVFLGDLCVLERSGRFKKSLVSGGLWTWADGEEVLTAKGAKDAKGGLIFGVVILGQKFESGAITKVISVSSVSSVFSCANFFASAFFLQEVTEVTEEGPDQVGRGHWT